MQPNPSRGTSLYVLCSIYPTRKKKQVIQNQPNLNF